MKSTFEEELQKHGHIAFTNVGVSMMPLIRQNKDIMLIKKKGKERCKKYDVVLYKIGNRYILHRIIKVRKNDYVIIGDHCVHKEYGITDQQIIGVLEAVIRDGKRIDQTNKIYQIYVHLWCDFLYIRIMILYMKSLLRRIRR
ncbi:hypothetical protein [Kandleria vitulina]|uniref:hypothetical protein n=1 Tax=Kandleria vitulina TaxID=1630 RepID=UPI000D1A8FE5